MTIRPYTMEERERFEEFYDRIDENGFEFDLEPKIEEDGE